MFCKKISSTYDPRVVYSIGQKRFVLYILPDSNGGVKIIDCPPDMNKEQAETYCNKWLISAFREFEKNTVASVTT